MEHDVTRVFLAYQGVDQGQGDLLVLANSLQYSATAAHKYRGSIRNY